MPEKPKWHDLLVFELDGTPFGSVKEVIAGNPEAGRQLLHDCLLALKNLGVVTRLVFVPPSEGHRWPKYSGEGARLSAAVDWEGFEWHLSSDDMSSGATAVLALAIGSRDVEVAQAVFQAIRSIAEVYQHARGSAVFAELNQIAFSVYVPAAELAGDQLANWGGELVRAHLTEMGRQRFPAGLTGRLCLKPFGALEGVEVGGHELAAEEVHGFVRMVELPGAAP
jgi:hypothetical protein